MVQVARLAWEALGVVLGVLVWLVANVGHRLVVVGVWLVMVVLGPEGNLVQSEEPIGKCIGTPPQLGSLFR